MPKVSESVFQNVLKEKLGDSWERSLTLFRNCGEHLGWGVTNVLMHAADKGKVSEVLDTIEEHYTSHLQYQHPEIRGTVGDRLLGVNPTERMFLKICQETLGLQPTAA